MKVFKGKINNKRSFSDMMGDKPHQMYKSMLVLPLAKKIQEFLLDELTIIRMIDAANLKRASIDPIADDLFKTCEKEFDKMSENEFDKWKQFIGYLIYKIMLENGYDKNNGGNVPLKSSNGNKNKLFKNGKKYFKTNNKENK